MRGGTQDPYEDCGKKTKVIACGDPSCKKKPEVVIGNCHRYECKVCNNPYDRDKRIALSRPASEISERLVMMAGEYRKYGMDLGGANHFTFSPDPKKWTREKVEADGGKALFKEFKRVLKHAFEDADVEEEVRGRKVCKKRNDPWGGAWFFHSERYQHEDGTACFDDHCRRKHVWIWSPHFHYLGYGYAQNYGMFFRRQHWSYKKIQNSGERDIYKTAKYELSHVSLLFKEEVIEHDEGYTEIRVKRIGKAYRYVGKIADRFGGKVLKSREKREAHCPVCEKEGRESFLYEYHVHENGDDLEIDRASPICVHEEIIEIYEWRLKHPISRMHQEILCLTGSGGIANES